MDKDIGRLNEIFDGAKSDSLDGHDRIDKYRRFYRDNTQEKKSAKKTGMEPIRSTYRSRAIKKLFKKKMSMITEPILSDDFLFTSSGWNIGYTKEDRLLNYQWNIQIDKQAVVSKSAKNLIIDGTAILKTEWETKEVEKVEDVEVQIFAKTEQDVIYAYPNNQGAIDAFRNGQDVPIGSTIKKEKVIKVISSKPTVKVIEPTNMYFGPNDVVIERIRMSYIDIISSASIDVRESILKEAFETSDNYSIDDMWISYQEGSGYELISSQRFVTNYRDLALKEIDVYQYWGKFSNEEDGVDIEKEMVIVWTGNTILSKIENPYSHKKAPYSVGTFESYDESKFGESESEVLNHDQTAITTISRVLHSLVLNVNSGQKLYRDGLFPSPQDERNYLTGKSAKFNKAFDVKDSIISSDIPTISNGAYDLIGMFSQSFIESDLAGGASNKDETGQDIVASVNDAALLRSYLALLTSVAGFINSMNIQLQINETTIIDALGSTVVPSGYLKEINRDLRYVASARTPHEKRQMANSIEKLMSTSGGNMDEKISLSHYIELALISNNYALAMELSVTLDNLKNPPPDPMEEIMLEREQLENERIRAETIRLKSQANENDAKAIEKLNKVEEMTARSETMLNEAKAMLTKAESAKSMAETEFFKNELDYVRSGRKQRDQEIRDEYQHGANLEREEVRTYRELKLNNMKAEQAKLDKANSEKTDKEVKKDDKSETFLQAYQKTIGLKNKETNAIGNAKASVFNGSYADDEEENQYGEAIKPN